MSSSPFARAAPNTSRPIRTGTTKSSSPWETHTGMFDDATMATVLKWTRATSRQNATRPGRNIRRPMSRADENGDCRMRLRGASTTASSAAMALPSEWPKYTVLAGGTRMLSRTNESAARASVADAAYVGLPGKPSYPRYSGSTTHAPVSRATSAAQGTDHRERSALPWNASRTVRPGEQSPTM